MVKEEQRGGAPRVMQACEPLPSSQLQKSSSLVVRDAQACDGFACVWANSCPSAAPQCCEVEGGRGEELGTQMLFLKPPSFRVRCQNHQPGGCASVALGAGEEGWTGSDG